MAVPRVGADDESVPQVVCVLPGQKRLVRIILQSAVQAISNGLEDVLGLLDLLLAGPPGFGEALLCAFENHGGALVVIGDVAELAGHVRAISLADVGPRWMVDGNGVTWMAMQDGGRQ